MKTLTFSQIMSPDSYLEPHYVGVLQLLQQGDLSDGGAGDSLVLRLQADLLHGHDLSGLQISPWERNRQIKEEEDSPFFTNL